MAAPFGQGALLWSEGFAYTDGDLATTGSAKWAEPVATGDASRHIRADTGQLLGPTGAGWAGAFTLEGFADADFIIPIAASPLDGSQLLVHLLGAHEGEGGITAYTLNHTKNAAANDRVRLQRWAASSVAATLIDNSDFEWAAGDALGLRRLSPLLALYRLPSGGSWAQVGADQSDATLTSGRIMVETNSGLTAIDGIEVRSNASSSPPRQALRRFQHLLVR